MEEKIRAFISIDFPDEIVKEIARVQEVLRTRKFAGKLTELGNLHLTLKFLGEIDKKKLGMVKKELRKIACDGFEAKLDGAGTFSYRGRPRIVWIKVGGKGIFDLQKEVDSAMEKCGFGEEDRFMSHLTLARIKYVKSPGEFKEYVQKLSVKPLKWDVKEFKLMKSELKPSGPVYTKIEGFGLV